MKGIEDLGLEEDQEKDHYFNLFHWISVKTPGQILRYTRHCPGIEPMWYRKAGRLAKEDIKHCKHCGGELIFEFQIMPQLFNFVHELAKVDWGTIVIYS